MSWVLITGSNRGIGLGLTAVFLKNGHSVVAACRNPDGARDLWELENAFPGKLRLLKLDVNDSADIEQMQEEIGALKIDTLINNAGVIGEYNGSLSDVKVADIAQTIATNVLGPVRLCQALMPRLAQSPGSKVIQISSRVGSIADNQSGGLYGYRMSKAALNMFNCNLAHDYPQNICVVMHPGWVQTAMGGPNALISVDGAVSKIYTVISSLQGKHSGQFLNSDGEIIPW